ncbi:MULTISPECIES: hypothetical protein [unclassified Frankia]|nr:MULTISPECIES: hypothetical protein [unclassified Frankia]
MAGGQDQPSASRPTPHPTPAQDNPYLTEPAIRTTPSDAFGVDL